MLCESVLGSEPAAGVSWSCHPKALLSFPASVPLSAPSPGTPSVIHGEAVPDSALLGIPEQFQLQTQALPGRADPEILQLCPAAAPRAGIPFSGAFREPIPVQGDSRKICLRSAPCLQTGEPSAVQTQNSPPSLGLTSHSMSGGFRKTLQKQTLQKVLQKRIFLSFKFHSVPPPTFLLGRGRSRSFSF